MSLFSSSYWQADERIVTAARGLGWSVTGYPLIAQDGRELWIRSARTPQAGEQGWLVISGGLHGVEGFVGSAIQLAVLQSDLPARARRSGVGLLLVHALNPFGMAYFRRVDQWNVDLNRNALAVDADYHGAGELYDLLEATINPPRAPRRVDRLTFGATAAQIMLRYGKEQVSQAIAGGQYKYPRGLFYGGTSLSQNLAHLREVLSGLSGASRVLHLDIHTGLGRRGQLHLLAEPELRPGHDDRLQQLCQRFPVVLTQSPQLPHQARGTIGNLCRVALRGSQYVHFCLELGTRQPLAVFSALRLENMAYHFGDPSGRHRWARDQLVEAFCPPSARWRANAVRLGLECVEHGLQFFER